MKNIDWEDVDWESVKYFIIFGTLFFVMSVGVGGVAAFLLLRIR